MTITVRVMILDGGIFQPYEIYKQDGIARVNVLEGCFIELNKVFSNPLSLLEVRTYLSVGTTIIPNTKP